MRKYRIEIGKQIDNINIEGRYIEALLKDGRKVQGDVYYQGDLDWDKLNANLGAVSIGYDYFVFEDDEEFIKYDDVVELTVHEPDFDYFVED